MALIAPRSSARPRSRIDAGERRERHAACQKLRILNRQAINILIAGVGELPFEGARCQNIENNPTQNRNKPRVRLPARSSPGHKTARPPGPT
jgi:hypothetical protein